LKRHVAFIIDIKLQEDGFFANAAHGSRFYGHAAIAEENAPFGGS